VRQGNRNPVASPSDVFPTADGWMVIAAGNDRQFAQLCRAIEHEALASEPRFASNELRVNNREALTDVLSAALRMQPTNHWLDVLDRHQVPCARINSMAQVFQDPQVQHRQMTVDVAHGSGRRIPLLRSTLNMSDSPAPHRAPPQLGEHTSEVLEEWLAMSHADTAQLCAQGVVAAR
jgi:crotonobetainyl-CoA:carnitine CoA-transferase CaiB-like acyl-CoA transferase